MKFKRGLTFIVILALSMMTIAGCSNSNTKDNENTNENINVTTEVSKKNETSNKVKEIVDHNGRTVCIPENIERVVTTSILPFPSVYFLANGTCEGLVGIHPASKSAAEVSMLGKMSPAILDAKTDFIKGSEINIEELLSLNPDLVYFLGSKKKEEEVLSKVDIPAVGIKTMELADGNSIETLSKWLKLLGKINNNEKRANEIVENAYQSAGMIHSRIWNIPDDKKPKGLILFNHGNKQMKVSGNHFFGQYWLEATGAKNVAESLNCIAEVNMEQIYKWDPEVIYITNFSSTIPEDLYNNTIEGEDWSNVSAVKNKRVYKIPLGVYRWFPPSADAPLMLKWMATKNQPDLFKDIDMEEEVRVFYKKYYNYDLTDEEINTIFNPVRESAKGY